MHRYLSSLVGIVVAILLGYGIHATPLGTTLDRALFDRVNTETALPSLVLVAIDDASLATYGAWPWDRSIFARLVDATHEARLLAFDVLFLEPRSGDDAVERSLARSPRTSFVFAEKDKQTSVYSSRTDETFGGVVHVVPDDDGVVRRMMYGFEKENTCELSFGARIHALYTKKERACDEQVSGFAYISGIQTVSLKDVIEKSLPPETFRNKILLVGATSLDMGDVFVGPQGEKIPGVMIHASYLQALLTGTTHTPIPFVAAFLVVLFLAGIVFFISRMRRLATQLMSLGMVLVFGVVLSIVTLSFGYRMSFDLAITVPIIYFIYLTIVRYVTTERSHKKIESLFGAYVHKDVLKTLMKSSGTLALGGEKKDLTILFSDIRNFTTYSEGVTPDVLVETMNAYFSHMTPAITNEFGTIDKYIGDAIMAFWNAPLPVKDHPVRAVYAALAMEDALGRFNEATGNTFGIGIGIHTGQAVVGNIGSKERVSYTALGDTINLGSRIEGLTKNYGVTILVSEDVVKQCDDATIEFIRVDTVQVKGREEPVTVYTVKRKGR